MDPITRSLRRCADEAEAFWKARPGRVLPLIGEAEQRGHVVQALRLRECAPDNRRPFVVVEAPFTSAASYFRAAAAQIADHYESIRKGAEEERVALPAFPAAGARPGDDLAHAVLTANRAAQLLGDRFAGLVVALVPEHVADCPGWRESIRVLAAMQGSPRVRLAALAPPEGPLGEVLGSEGARFGMDPGELLSMLDPRAPGARDGEPESEPPAGERLRGLLLEAAEAQHEGRTERAATFYERARSVCRTEGLVEQEAMVLVALAGACLAAGAPALATSSYHEAAILAAHAEAWPLACQAWLGMGGALLSRADHEAAVLPYRSAAAAAARAQLTPLRLEALRMAGSCLLDVHREDDAILVWKEAIDVAVEDAHRGVTCFKDVGRLLATLLERRGCEEQAAQVRARVGADLST
jgi:tetratricopeptide (TPR) repeat protein